jgi:hypothetical protein
VSWEWSASNLASGVLTAELRAFSMLHRNRRPTPARVLLACGDEEQHALPVYALEAALAEHKIPSVVLGQALPPAALARAMVTRQPAAVFIWASMAQPAMGRTVWRTSLREPCRILLGGPGWQGVATGANGALRVERTDGMGDAVTQDLCRAARLSRARSSLHSAGYSRSTAIRSP